MRKTFWLVLAVLLIAVPAFAQLTLKDASSDYGQIKKIQVLSATVTESGGTGIIDVASLIPAATDPVLTIEGTTALGSTTTASIAINNTSATAKTASIKIHYTGYQGVETTGWIQVYSSAQ
jgi:hypothetical protein